MAVMKALGELNRLRIMRLLLKEQPGVNAIADRVKISQYNVSKHLRILKEAGLLDMEKAGKERLYGVAAVLKHELAATQGKIQRAFGVPKVAVQRALARYRAHGSKAFFMPPPPRRGRKLTPEVLMQAQAQYV